MSDEWGGDCTCMNTAAGVEVIHADPRIRVSAEMVKAMRGGYGAPVTSLDGDVLTIRAVNRTVVYVLGEYELMTDSYRAEWPD